MHIELILTLIGTNLHKNFKYIEKIILKIIKNILYLYFVPLLFVIIKRKPLINMKIVAVAYQLENRSDPFQF